MENNYLAHHGILGMKWGVRRYQNEDGSLTPAGRERYQKGLAKELKETYKKHGPLAPISADAKNLAENSKVFRRYKETYAAPDNFLKSRREQLKSDKEYAKKYAKRYFEHERDLAKKSANSQEALDKMISIIDQDEKSVSWAKDSHLADEVIFFNEGDKYDKLIDENIKAAREWSKEHRRIAKDALGKYGDVKLRAKWDNKKYKTTASNFLKFALNYADVDPSINNGMDYSKLVHAIFSDEEDDHLEHHGILGMKWYHRRFQNEDGSLTPAGRERYGVGEAREGSSDKPKKPGIVERHKQKKEEKRKAAEKAARVKRMQEGKARKAEEKKTAEEHEAAKQKALRSAKASEIMKYRDELTDQEMKDAVARIGWDEALRKKAKEENPDKLTKAMKVVDKYGKAAGSIATATENTTKMYNNIAKALNTFTGSDWPLVGDSKKDQNNSDKGSSDKPNNKPNNKPGNKPNEGKPSKKDKENFEKTMKEAAKILGEAAKKVDEESKKQAEDKHDWTADDKPSSNGSSSSSSGDKGVFDTKFEYSDAKAERAEQIGRDAVERYLQLEDKRKG